ncbi:MAG: methyltransferase, partial [Armatimonadetes bacterium CG_4_8_14_3_um_filter_58_9]
MTSRERVLAAIEHREPDRVPVDLGGMRSTGIMAIAYNRLREYLGWEAGNTKVYDVIQQLAQPDDDALDFWQADVVDMGRAFLTADTEWKDWTLPDGSPGQLPAYINLKPRDGGWVCEHADGTIIGRMPKGVQYVSQCHWPMADLEEPWDLKRVPEWMGKVTWAAMPTAPYHKPLTPEHLNDIRQTARQLCETTDKAIMIAFGGNFLEWGQFLRRIDNFLMDVAASPGQVAALLDRLLELHISNAEKILPAINGSVQIIQLGDDLGSQSGAQISPDTFRKLFKPRLKALIAHVKTLADIKIFLHSCGSVEELL